MTDEELYNQAKTTLEDANAASDDAIDYVMVNLLKSLAATNLILANRALSQPTMTVDNSPPAKLSGGNDYDVVLPS